MLQKNQIIPLTITDITHQGQGVGHHEGIAVFVPMTAVGDQLKVRVVKVLKNYCFGKVEEILSPSPNRVENDCPVYRRCGGCSFRHLSYEEEQRFKNNWVFENFRRIGGVDLPQVPLLPSPKEEGYRNKAQFPVQKKDGKVAIGFYAPRSHEVIPCVDCRLQPPSFARILTEIQGFLERENISIYDETTGKGLVRHIYLRYGEVTGEIMVCLVINGKSLPKEGHLVKRLLEVEPGIASVILNTNTKNTNVILGKECRTLYGKDHITDLLCDVKVDISPLAFYQVNRSSAENLYRKAAEFAALTGEETLVDLYCGAGTIGLSMAGQVKELIGVEIIPEAVENARSNARKNGVKNARFLCADASQAATALADEGIRPDVVVVDPPRKGCDLPVLEAIARMAPSRVVYISCNSATAARDCAEFAKLGYRAVKAQAVDLFPRTCHVETVVLLSKLNTRQHIEVEVKMDELDLTAAESKATYEEIKAYVLEHTGLKVSHLYIAQIKQKYGIIERENYNKPKSENSRQPKCPPEKEVAITEALKYYGMM